MTTPSNFTRSFSRWMTHIHLWIGVSAAALVIVISVTGIMLNHKQLFGFQPDPPGAARTGLAEALPMLFLVSAAEAAAGEKAAAAGVDRLDVRPDKGIMKVRFDDRLATEVTVAIHTGEVLATGTRDDVFLEKLHSGEIFGDNWVLISDALAIGLIILLLTGFWMWLYPRARM